MTVGFLIDTIGFVYRRLAFGSPGNVVWIEIGAIRLISRPSQGVQLGLISIFLLESLERYGCMCMDVSERYIIPWIGKGRFPELSQMGGSASSRNGEMHA